MSGPPREGGGGGGVDHPGTPNPHNAYYDVASAATLQRPLRRTLGIGPASYVTPNTSEQFPLYTSHNTPPISCHASGMDGMS